MTWTGFLDAYEDRIDRAEHALEAGTELPAEVLEPYNPPTDLGPFPSFLAERAQTMLERNNALVENLRVAMGGLRSELNTMQREATAVRGYDPEAKLTVSKYFDQPA